MVSGGARNRSGPQPSPTSGRSDRRGVSFSSLPASGYDGEAPEFPLLPYTVQCWEFEDGDKFQVTDQGATESFRDRETDLWAWAWTTPQASAWAREPWRWQAVAQWVRTSVICETGAATAADRGSLHRFADQIGMTPAGLKENGWVVSHDAPAETSGPTTTPQARASSRDRLKLVSGGSR